MQDYLLLITVAADSDSEKFTEIIKTLNSDSEIIYSLANPKIVKVRNDDQKKTKVYELVNLLIDQKIELQFFNCFEIVDLLTSK